jgi:hypothetical protein
LPLAPLIALVVGVAGLSACQPATPVPPQGNGKQAPPPPGSAYTCKIRINPPYKGNFQAQGMRKSQAAIIAVSEAYCDATPISHVVSLKLRHYVDHGGWQQISNFYGQPFQTCGEIPPPTEAGKPARCVIAIPCVMPGRYRAEAVVTGTAVNADGQQQSYSVTPDPSTRSR